MYETYADSFELRVLELEPNALKRVGFLIATFGADNCVERDWALPVMLLVLMFVSVQSVSRPRFRYFVFLLASFLRRKNRMVSTFTLVIIYFVSVRHFPEGRCNNRFHPCVCFVYETLSRHSQRTLLL